MQDTSCRLQRYYQPCKLSVFLPFNTVPDINICYLLRTFAASMAKHTFSIQSSTSAKAIRLSAAWQLDVTLSVTSHVDSAKWLWDGNTIKHTKPARNTRKGNLSSRKNFFASSARCLYKSHMIYLTQSPRRPFYFAFMTNSILRNEYRTISDAAFMHIEHQIDHQRQLDLRIFFPCSSSAPVFLNGVRRRIWGLLQSLLCSRFIISNCKRLLHISSITSFK